MHGQQLMESEWRPVAGYEGLYEVSNAGQIRSLDHVTTDKNGRLMPYKGRAIKALESGAGYKQVCLSRNGKQTRLYIHRLVADAFCVHPSGADVVNHIDHDRGNNTSTNLEWVTVTENNRHSGPLGRHPKLTCRPTNTGEKYITYNGRYYVVSLQKENSFKSCLSLRDAIEWRDAHLGA